jgi:D-beta-D-heptose 7-phosphate kinase/D-beta-D-heptose 1-phosphate adenosyltransferase
MKKIINYLKSSDTKDVLIIGDIILDEYLFGDVSRISPEAPVPVIKIQKCDRSLGGAANVAGNCKHIGFNVQLVGLVGDCDKEGAAIASMLDDLKISHEGMIKSPYRSTTSKKRLIAKSNQMLRVDAEDDFELNDWEFKEIINRINKLMVPGSIVLISDYAKGVVTPAVVAHVVEKARELGCIILVDPKGPHFGKYYGVDYLKPNLKEFNQLLEAHGLFPFHDLVSNARAICSLLSLKGIIITQGEQGMQFVSQTQHIISPAVQKEVYDITGAGDTVCAFLAIGFVSALPIDDCLKLANAAAAVAVSHLKTYAVSLEELLDTHAESTKKVFSDWAQLKIELDWLRADGKKMVLTNGCFDILHSGHVHVLREAKRLGDILVVALNTDDSIKRLKGPQRPVNDLAERAAMVSALDMVDFVVSFGQDTPLELIEYLRPDILVKGGDYVPETIVGHDFVTGLGGSVHIIDLVPGKSTTRTISAMSRTL